MNKTSNLIRKFITIALVLLIVLSSFIIIKNQGISGLINVLTGNQPTTPVQSQIEEDGHYTSKEDVALFIHTFNHLPDNYMSKNEAKQYGWNGGPLDKIVAGYSIGGDKYSNFEKKLPTAKGRVYFECDIDAEGKKERGAKRIVYSNDGLIYYTDDHYESFELLYEGQD